MSNPSVNSNWSHSPETHNFPCDIENWWMILKNNRALLVYYVKLCASFQIRRWCQTWVTVWKRSIRFKIGNFLSRVTLKFDGWPWKTTGHLFLTTLSFVQHFKAIAYSNWSHSPETLNSGQNWRFVVPCDIEYWRMTLKNNRVPLLYYVKLCASFQIHRWSQIWVIVRKRSIWVIIGYFLSRVTLKFNGWPWKTIGHLFYTTLSFAQNSKAIGVLKLELQSGNARFKPKLEIFCPAWPWKLTDDLEKL